MLPLEGPAKHTYQVYVRQQQITGFSYILIGLVIAIFAIILYIRNYKKADWQDGNFSTVMTVISIVLIFVVVVTSLLEFPISFSKLLNPEYHAIEKIVDSFKK